MIFLFPNSRRLNKSMLVDGKKNAPQSLIDRRAEQTERGGNQSY